MLFLKEDVTDSGFRSITIERGGRLNFSAVQDLSSQKMRKTKVIITTNVIIYSLLTAVVVVPQQVPWGASLLRPRPQKPRLPRGLRLERAAVAFLRRATMLRIALNRLTDVPRVDIELQHGSSGEVEFPLRIYSN